MYLIEFLGMTTPFLSRFRRLRVHARNSDGNSWGKLFPWGGQSGACSAVSLELFSRRMVGSEVGAYGHMSHT